VTKKNELADRVLEITRIFDAPRALVFAAWTDPAHLKHWMGPRDRPAIELGGELRQGRRLAQLSTLYEGRARSVARRRLSRDRKTRAPRLHLRQGPGGRQSRTGGLLGSLFLTDPAHKVRRGMQGVIRDGRHAGGRAYGYRPVPGKPGELEIVEEEAQVVRQIFFDYVGGKTPREIAFALNKKKVAPPRGGKWTASTINGNKKRHHGILLNELYAGQVIWNRVKMIKDPDTGRRISRSNPSEEWKRAEARHLAIVDAALFNAAQQRKTERTFEAPQKQRKAKFVLSGLLKCGCCGGGLSMKDRDHGRVRIHCSTMRESGSCENRKIFYMDDVEKSVLAGLQQHLKAPRLLKEFAKSYQEERERLASEKRRIRGKLETQLGQIQRMHPTATTLLHSDFCQSIGP
jgi:Recombinase/Recombinase zinc beta ribbon domain/Activator of Hsp90 ATPase homolog 1-like protein